MRDSGPTTVSPSAWGEEPNQQQHWASQLPPLLCAWAQGTYRQTLLLASFLGADLLGILLNDINAPDGAEKTIAPRI